MISLTRRFQASSSFVYDSQHRWSRIVQKMHDGRRGRRRVSEEGGDGSAGTSRDAKHFIKWAASRRRSTRLNFVGYACGGLYFARFLPAVDAIL